MIFLGSDHAGFDLKQKIIAYLAACSLPYQDGGTYNHEPCDYPDIAKSVCHQLLVQPQAKGILICGTGIGMSIAANRYQHIRAAVCNKGEKDAYFARAHNDANILCLGARLVDEDQALLIIRAFLHTPFENGRHQTRLDKI